MLPTALVPESGTESAKHADWCSQRRSHAMFGHRTCRHAEANGTRATMKRDEAEFAIAF
jgi:hypothetical protein